MFWGGHTRSFFFSLSCHCSRALFPLLSLPLSHALCVAFAYLLSSPLLFVWGTHTRSYSYACNLPPFSSSIRSFVLHSRRSPFMCVFSCRHCGGCRGILATCFPAYGVRFSIVPPSSSRLGLVAFFSSLLRRARFMHSWHAMLLILYVMDSLFFATPKSKRVLLLAWRHTLFTLRRTDSLFFCDAQE